MSVTYTMKDSSSGCVIVISDGEDGVGERCHPCKLLHDMQTCINVLSAGLIHTSRSCQLRGSGMANYGSISNFVCVCVMLELPCSLGEYNRCVKATSPVRLRVCFPVHSTF